MKHRRREEGIDGIPFRLYGHTQMVGLARQPIKSTLKPVDCK